MRFIISMSCGLLSAGTFAQTLVTQVKPVGSNRWGYMNINGQMLVQPAFKQCSHFSESGRALVGGPGKRRAKVIALDGKVVGNNTRKIRLVSSTESIEGFSDGYALVKVRRKNIAFVDTVGQLRFADQYDAGRPFRGGHTVVEKKGKAYIISGDGEVTPVRHEEFRRFGPPNENGLFRMLQNSKLGFADAHQNVVIPATFESVGYFSCGLAYAGNSTSAFGFIDTTGQWVIQPKYNVVREFDPSTGLAMVHWRGEWIYIDRAGNEVHVPDVTWLDDFSEGLAACKRKKRIGFVDRTGKWVIEPQFRRVRRFKNGYASVKKKKYWGVIDQTGKWVLEAHYKRLKDFELVR